MTPRVPAMLEATFEPTLNMITKDFAEYPEHRFGFYTLLQAINKHCFPGTLTNTMQCSCTSLTYFFSQHYSNFLLPSSNYSLTALSGASSTQCATLQISVSNFATNLLRTLARRTLPLLVLSINHTISACFRISSLSWRIEITRAVSSLQISLQWI